MPQDPSPLPFPLVRRRSAHNSQAFGHFRKRPFTNPLLICKNTLSRGPEYGENAEAPPSRLIGYARVSFEDQGTDPR